MKKDRAGQSAFLNLRVLLCVFMSFGAVLFSLFPVTRPQAGIRERAGPPNRLSLAPSGGVHEAWVVRYDGPKHFADSANDIALDGSGNVYVTGGSAVSSGPPDYVTIKYNSAGQQQWLADFSGGNNTANFANAIALDASGNVYVTGIAWGYGNDSDYGTVKYNSAGEQQWVARYDGPGHNLDTATAIAVDSAGNVYVTGRSPGLGTYYDYATIKYSASGQEEWVARYNGPGNDNDAARAIAVDGSGNVYVTGVSTGSASDFDYATIKYSPLGEEEWVARYNGPGNGIDSAYAMAVDGSGNVYVTGISFGSGTDYDATTIKYSPSGEELWVARYNGPGNGYDAGYAIVLDGSGNVIVTGSSISTTDYDYLTIKYNAAGQQQWVTRYRGPASGQDEATYITVDRVDNVYVTGYSTGLGTDYDYATIKYSPSGDEQWVARYNGTGNFGDVASGVAVDSSGNVYVTGSSDGPGTNSDYVTIKYVQPPLPTPTPTATASPTPTQTSTPTPSATATATATVTPTARPSPPARSRPTPAPRP